MNFKAYVFAALFCVASSLFSFQNGYVADSGGTTVSVFNPQTNTAIPPPIPVQMNPGWLGVLPNQSKIYVVNTTSNSVTVIHAATNSTTTVPVGNVPVSLAITPDGSKVFVVDEGSGPTDGAVTVIETVNDTVVATIGMADGIGQGPFRIAITPNGAKAFVTNSTDGTVSVINTSTYAVSGPIVCGAAATNLALTPDGSKLFVCNFATDTVTVIDTVAESFITNVTVGTMMGFTGPIAIAITPDGTKAFVCDLISAEVSMIDTTTYAVNNLSVGMGSQPQGLAITLDGTKVFVIQASNEYSVIDASNNTLIITQPMLPMANPFFIILSPDGKSLYVCNAGLSSLSVIDVATNNIIGSPIPVGANPGFIAFADSGPPTNFSGSLGKNTFLSQTALVNILSWGPPLDSSQLSSYRIYRNADLTDLAGEVPASGPLVFVDQARKGQIATYYLVAVDKNGAESAAAVTSVP